MTLQQHHTNHLSLSLLPGRYSICRMDAETQVPQWAIRGAFFSVTRTVGELSVVCETAAVPPGVQAENDWRVFAVQGPLNFGLIGIVAELSGRLAAAAVSIFVVSTYDTDYLLVREVDVNRAVAALREAGHSVFSETDSADQFEGAV